MKQLGMTRKAEVLGFDIKHSPYSSEKCFPFLGPISFGSEDHPQRTKARFGYGSQAQGSRDGG